MTRGRKGRAPYRFLNRDKDRKPREKSARLEKRFVVEEVLSSFFNDQGLVNGCCSNECCRQLLGVQDGSSLLVPSREELDIRTAFRDAVLETRKAIHEGGQVKSRDRLLARLRMGFTEGTRPLRFNPNYSFPGSRSTSKQEYWWRTEEGDCIQVSPHNN